MKMPTIFAENFSCSAIFSKKEFASVSNLGFISRENFILSRIEHAQLIIIHQWIQVTVIYSHAIFVTVMSEYCVKRIICKAWTGLSAGK